MCTVVIILILLVNAPKCLNLIEKFNVLHRKYCVLNFYPAIYNIFLCPKFLVIYCIFLCIILYYKNLKLEYLINDIVINICYFLEILQAWKI